MIPKFSEMTGSQKVVYGLGMLVVLAVLGPLAAIASQTVTSLFTALIYGVGIFAVAVMFPFINRFLKAMALKLMKGVARLNPIETLNLDFMKKSTALKAFVKFVTEMIASHNVSQNELDALKKRFPDRDLSDRQVMMDKMGQAVALLRTKATEAESTLAKYGEEIEFITADNAWAQRAGGAMAKMQAVEGVDALDELLKGEAIGQVRQNVAQAFAELDMMLGTDDAQAALQLTHDKNPDTIDGTAVEIPHFFDMQKVPA